MNYLHAHTNSSYLFCIENPILNAGFKDFFIKTLFINTHLGLKFLLPHMFFSLSFFINVVQQKPFKKGYQNRVFEKKCSVSICFNCALIENENISSDE